MKHIKTKTLIAATMICMTLAGCAKEKNPLIKDETIALFKSRMMNEEFLGYPFKQCGEFYAGYVKPTAQLQSTCDTWVKEEFTWFSRNPTTSAKATLENYKDPALWKIILPKKN